LQPSAEWAATEEARLWRGTTKNILTKKGLIMPQLVTEKYTKIFDRYNRDKTKANPPLDSPKPWVRPDPLAERSRTTKYSTRAMENIDSVFDSTLNNVRDQSVMLI
jgi:hypothetical protein